MTDAAVRGSARTRRARWTAHHGWLAAATTLVLGSYAERVGAQPEVLAPPPPPPPPAELGASGLVLMVAAYASIWLVAFAFIVLTLRRQRQLDARIERMATQLERLLDDESRGEPTSSLTGAVTPDRSHLPLD